MDLSNFIVLLARQRSGTNALRSALDAHPDIFCLPEVFNPGQRYWREANWFEFLERRGASDIVSAMRSDEAQEQLFLDYLRSLRPLSEKRLVVIDVKYNSMHHLDGPWRHINEPPSMFGFIKRHRVRVLNLTRRNLLRFYLSQQKAASSGQWNIVDPSGARHEPWFREGEHDRPPDPQRRDTAIAISPEGMLWALEQARAEDAIVARELAGYDLAWTVEYDDLFAELGAPPAEEQLGAIAAWLGVEPRFDDRPLTWRKQAVTPLRDSIENYDEIEGTLRGTSFEYLLEDERMYRAGAPGAE